MLHSHKATHEAARFLGMTVTIPHPLPDQTVCINADPAKVRSLISCLSPCESVVVTNSRCDTRLLGTDWYVLEYTNQYANVVGFDECVVHKSGLPIVVMMTKFILLDNKGVILL